MSLRRGTEEERVSIRFSIINWFIRATCCSTLRTSAASLLILKLARLLHCSDLPLQMGSACNPLTLYESPGIARLEALSYISEMWLMVRRVFQDLPIIAADEHELRPQHWQVSIHLELVDRSEVHEELSEVWLESALSHMSGSLIDEVNGAVANKLELCFELRSQEVHE